MSKRDAADQVRFLHFRAFETVLEGTEDGGVEVDVPAATGGATVAYVPEGVGFRYAIAYCSERDNFNRRVGRVISKGRLQSDTQSQMSEQADRASFAEAMDEFFETAWDYHRR